MDIAKYNVRKLSPILEFRKYYIYFNDYYSF